MTVRIKVDDTVEVLSGDEKGQRGKVLSVNHDAGKAIVEGMNRVFKHVRRSQKNPQGGRLNKEMPIELSNLQVVCTSCAKRARTGARYLDDGSKERFCRKCGASLGEMSPSRTAYAKK